MDKSKEFNPDTDNHSITQEINQMVQDQSAAKQSQQSVSLNQEEIDQLDKSQVSAIGKNSNSKSKLTAQDLTGEIEAELIRNPQIVENDKNQTKKSETLDMQVLELEREGILPANSFADRNASTVLADNQVAQNVPQSMFAALNVQKDQQLDKLSFKPVSDVDESFQVSNVSHLQVDQSKDQSKDETPVEIIYEPAEIPLEMINQFSIKKDGPVGKVKVDEEGNYVARRLESDSEQSPDASQSRIDQSGLNESGLGLNKSGIDKSRSSLGKAGQQLVAGDTSGKKSNMSAYDRGANKSNMSIPSQHKSEMEKSNSKKSELKESNSKASQEKTPGNVQSQKSLDGHKGHLASRVAKGFNYGGGTKIEMEDGDEEDSCESSHDGSSGESGESGEVDSDEELKQGGKGQVVDRIAAGFGGIFGKDPNSGKNDGEEAGLTWDDEEAKLNLGQDNELSFEEVKQPKTNKWLSLQKQTPIAGAEPEDNQNMMRSTWTKLSGNKALSLPPKNHRQSILASKMIREDLNESDKDSEEKRLHRIQNEDGDAPNEFSDEELHERQHKKAKLRAMLDDSPGKAEKKPIHQESKFIFEEAFDPNDPFSEFRFRSFRKDRQIQQDYTLINIEEPDKVSNLTASTVFSEAQLQRDAIELVEIDESQLIDHEKELLLKQKKQDKELELFLKSESKFIETQDKQTRKDLKGRKGDLVKLIKGKQERSKAEFEMKKDVLTNSFKASVDSLIKRVLKQKEIITASYGPIVLNSKKIEKPIFDINKELDPEGWSRLNRLNKIQDNLPQAIIVKLKTVRCMKDKVSSGHFLMIVHALDRIGGNRILEDPQKTDRKFKDTSKLLREFAIKKRIFLNTDNRQVMKEDDEGKTQFVKAGQTGIGFFQPKADSPQAVDRSIEMMNESDKLAKVKLDLSNQGIDADEIEKMQFERPIDKKKDIMIDLERSYCQYVRFNGRPQDDNIDFNDNICVMLPSHLETTNCLQFQLVLLKSETIPKDYVIGWGIFPLMNSDFTLNEGLFKVPLLFGGVNPTIDKFKKIETEMMRDLDKWIANLYFEVEKINLIDIKVEEETGNMFYQPVTGTSAQEQQQLLKMHLNDIQDQEKEAINDAQTLLSGGRPNVTAKKVEEVKDEWDVSSEEESVDSDDIDDDEKLDAEIQQDAEAYTEMIYDTDRTQEEIDYERYQFSVAQKYDLTTRRLTYKKIKYIADEIFLELHWRMRHTLAWQTSMFFILLIFFLRMFIHYTGQYIALRIMQVPIELFQPLWYRIDLKYAAFTWYQEAIVVVVGAVSNTAVFAFMYFLSYFTKRSCRCFPKIFYRIVCWMGIFAVLDPYIVLILDVVTANWDRGDMFKFYNWLNANRDSDASDSSLVGIYIVILIHFVLTVFTGGIFYRYMLHRFMDGRILDLYRRLAGNYKAFFMPSDSEISVKYLQWVITRAKGKDCVIMSDKRKIMDKYGILRNVEYVQILKIEKEILKKNRLFFKDHDGSLIEVPQSKVTVKSGELRKIKKRAKEQTATLFGEHANDGEFLEKVIQTTMNDIVMKVGGGILDAALAERQDSVSEEEKQGEEEAYMDFENIESGQEAELSLGSEDQDVMVQHQVQGSFLSPQNQYPKGLRDGIMSPMSAGSNLL